ncbi:class I SAM-dependent methyltransferase [Agrobacterium leguminum]|jgi:ubiquinone/menaquinone biosynthesis C-methylase UbiE|uniref:class I SAM-dependent methyltransferase n=1 Tax=Agrobacterium leguminum TaxID=2792015 RepID=UPI0021FFCE9F|nr:class I SAM-dependent methyltransferase [Agrobacterium tumefaciens]
MDGGNFDLKEEIRDYWSKRSETFDLAFGHRIASGPEAEAWQKPIRELIGPGPKRVLELACGTGEVTRLIHDLGHDVTALDFSEAMLAVARAKHAGKPRLRFIMADAENTMEPDASYDAIVCRHLVWTLTQPEQTFSEWFRLLRPGGRLLFFDGDWATPKPTGRLASLLISLIDHVMGADRNYDGALGSRHAAIMKALPFGQGLQPQMLTPLLIAAGFDKIELHSHHPIAKAQRKNANLRNRLRTFVYRRFILTCSRS